MCVVCEPAERARFQRGQRRSVTVDMRAHLNAVPVPGPYVPTLASSSTTVMLTMKRFTLSGSAQQQHQKSRSGVLGAGVGSMRVGGV